MVNSAQQWTTRRLWLIAIGYVLCWVVGLLVGGPTLDPGASSAEVTTAFAQTPQIVVFAVLVHGLAAGFLIALGWALASGSRTRVAVALACVAAALSLMQLAGEMALIFQADVSDPVVIWETVTRVDGVKMFVLVGLIVAVHGGRFAGRAIFSILSVVAAIALALSGIGYLTMNSALMAAANVSLPLLLVWVIAACAVRVSELRPVRKPAPV